MRTILMTLIGLSHPAVRNLDCISKAFSPLSHTRFCHTYSSQGEDKTGVHWQTLAIQEPPMNPQVLLPWTED
jgi:hypothetical protein